MGTLRFLLALSVAYGHAGDFLGFPMVPGDTAVQLFFVISGFYMALVLNEKYRAGSPYALFISNRFARLFPSYLAVLALTLVVGLIAWRCCGVDLSFVKAWRELPDTNFLAKVFLAGSQILIWGQDFYAFLTIKDGALSFSPYFNNAPVPLFPLLLIPQAWTLGIEISFYLCAPFIVRRSPVAIAVLLFASLALRLGLQMIFGLKGDPWSYRFFPSELALFLAGALGYRVYRAGILNNSRLVPMTLFALSVVCIGAALLISRWNGLSRVVSVGFLVAAALLVPVLFHRTRNIVFDRHLGELSYPIYICHMLVIWIAGIAMPATGSVASGMATIAGTLLFSIFLYVCIDTPVDRWRQRRFEFSKRKNATGVRTV